VYSVLSSSHTTAQAQLALTLLLHLCFVTLSILLRSRVFQSRVFSVPISATAGLLWCKKKRTASINNWASGSVVPVMTVTLNLEESAVKYHMWPWSKNTIIERERERERLYVSAYEHKQCGRIITALTQYAPVIGTVGAAGGRINSIANKPFELPVLTQFKASKLLTTGITTVGVQVAQDEDAVGFPLSLHSWVDAPALPSLPRRRLVVRGGLSAPYPALQTVQRVSLLRLLFRDYIHLPTNTNVFFCTLKLQSKSLNYMLLVQESTDSFISFSSTVVGVRNGTVSKRRKLRSPSTVSGLIVFAK